MNQTEMEEFNDFLEYLRILRIETHLDGMENLDLKGLLECFLLWRKTKLKYKPKGRKPKINKEIE